AHFVHDDTCFKNGMTKQPRIRPKPEVIEARCRAPSLRSAQSHAKRARMVLLPAEGCSTPSIAREVGVQPRIASNWRWRFADHHGLDGLEERLRGTRSRPLINKRI